MALLYHSTLTPSKLELIAEWAPHQTWFQGVADASFDRVGAFRFDDPDGEVGVETVLVRAGDGPVLQVPLTYRGAPLDGAEAWLIGTTEHSVLGTRWVYDAVGDPVYLSELARATLGGGTQVEQFYEENGERTVATPLAQVNGSGQVGFVAPSAHDAHPPATRSDLATTLAETDELAFLVARLPVANPIDMNTDADRLTGTWTDQPEPTILALVSFRP